MFPGGLQLSSFKIELAQGCQGRCPHGLVAQLLEDGVGLREALYSFRAMPLSVQDAAEHQQRRGYAPAVADVLVALNRLAEVLAGLAHPALINTSAAENGE